MQGFTVTQLYRPAVFELNSYQTFKIGNLDFNVPNYDLSFDTPQPSLSPNSLKKYYGNWNACKARSRRRELFQF